MARKFATKITYAGSREQLLKAITDRRFYELRAATANATLVTFDCKKNTSTGDIAIQTKMEVHAQTLPLDRLPSRLQQLIPATLHASVVEVWSPDLSNGSVQVTLAGVPVTVTATSTLTAQMDECVRYLTGEVKVSIPLLGSKIEEAIPLDKLTRLAETEANIFQRYLAQAQL